MDLDLRKDADYSLLIATSMGLRITPFDGIPFHCGDLFRMQVTSAESNVASVASYLGLPTKVLTAFVKDSPVARMIKDNLAARHMDYEGPEFEQDNPWGFRHQFNLADSGLGNRGPRVQNDRAGEVGRELDAKDFDLDRIFGEEGVQIVHLSGLIAALSPKTSQFCLEIARAAAKHGTKVSFDLNFRKSFWVGREEELSAAFTEIAETADILIGNEEDFQLCLGVKGPEAGGDDIAEQLDSFKAMMDQASKQFPNAKVFATTLREVVHANQHEWGGIIRDHGEFYVAPPRDIFVKDRIGGGDGFVGGMLYGILSGMDALVKSEGNEKAGVAEPGDRGYLGFAWATGSLAATMLTDYGQPADEDQVWSIWDGNARVKR